MGEYRVTFNGETQTFRFNEPVKFEVGQVVRVVEHDDGTVVGDAACVVARVSYDMIWCCDPRNLLYMDRYSTVSGCHRFAILSPAPRVGDKWTNGESVARVSADPDTAQLCLVTEGDPFVGDVVAVARRLWEGGYRVARARSASESSADVLASMARAGVKKWSDRGTLGVSNAADVRERFAAFMPRDPDLSGASGAPAYLTLDYLKALVPTHAEATARRMLTFDEMLASDPYARALIEDAHAGDLYSRVLVQADAEIKKAILGTSEREWQQQTAYPREVDGVFRDVLPRAGEVYEHDDGTVVELREGNGRMYTHVLHTRVAFPILISGERPEDVSKMLRDHGFKRAKENPFAAAPTRWTGERLRVEAAQWGIAPFAGETDTQLRERMEAMLRRPWKVLYPSDAVERVRDSTRVDRATGDDLRKLAQLHGVPELRVGMVVRHESLKGPAFGVVLDAASDRVAIRWTDDTRFGSHEVAYVHNRLSTGRWRIVDPDVRSFAALANAAAAIFTTPDLATSRRYIDMAIASVRGEPFAHAVAAVLVAASEVPLSAHTIAGIVRGARSHERRRSEVAPGRRELTVAQLLMCAAAAFYDADGCWDEQLSRVYERARAAG